MDVQAISADAWRSLPKIFWTMLAHCHGQIWNAAQPARALGVSPLTARRYLDRLVDAFMIRQLPPCHANIRKRQVKAPKICVRDSGLLHQLLGIGSEKGLLSHPKLDASWEGFVIEQVLALLQPDEASRAPVGGVNSPRFRGISWGGRMAETLTMRHTGCRGRAAS